MTNEEMSLKTKQMLSDALKEATAKKPFSKVTVSELISACNINRKTFYYHFTDIYALMKWTLEQDTLSVLEKIDLLVNTEEAIRYVVKYVEANKHIINCVFDSVGYLEMKRFFYADFIGVMRKAIDDGERRLEIKVDKEFKEFISCFYTEALAGMMLTWLQNRQTTDQEQLIQNILLVCQKTIPQLLREKAEPFRDSTDITE